MGMRLRGYHSTMKKLDGYQKGEIYSYYYVPKRNTYLMRKYKALRKPFWAKEFAVSWRDLDRDVYKA